jgi:microcystin-dependent protein
MAVKDWSSNEALNTTVLSGVTLDGSTMNVPLVDNALRVMAADIATQMGKLNWKGDDKASAATVDLATATGWYVDVTGTTTISSFGTVPAGQLFILRFASSLTLTHHATNLILPGGASIVVQPNDTVWMLSLGGGAWRAVNYSSYAGALVPPGCILDFGGSTAPAGYLLCYGQAVSRSTYLGLFNVIGVNYGVGDGSTTFNVPDFRGRTSAGDDDMGGVAAGRLTGAMSGATLGASGGEAMTTLAITNMPAHTHTQQGAFLSSGVSVGHTHAVNIGSTTESQLHDHFMSWNTQGQNVNHTHTHQLLTAFQNAGSGSGVINVWTGSNPSAVTSSESTTHVHLVSGTTGTNQQGHNHTVNGSTGAQTSDHTHMTTISGATTSTGSGTAISNVQPTLITTKIIKT